MFRAIVTSSLMLGFFCAMLPGSSDGASLKRYDNNVLPPAALQLNGSDVTAVVISNVQLLNRSLTVDVGSLWHDPLVQNPQPSFLDVNLTGSVFSSLSLTSSALLATNVSFQTDACDGMFALRPAPHWQLRSLRLFVLGTSSALEYNITDLLLCNASLTFTSMRQSSLRVSGSVLCNTVIRVGGDTRTLRVVLEAPLSLQRASAVAVDGARDLMWRLQSSAADAALRLSGGSVVSVRDCTFASAAPLYSGVTAGGGVGVALEGASHVVVARNRCSGASMCSAALSLGAVTLRGGSLLALSSNAFSVATMARSAAALALYRAGVFVSWASLRVVEASTFAVDGNDVATDSRGVYVAGGTAATPVAVDVASGGVVSIARNRVVFSRREAHVDASLPINATPIDFVFLCERVCLYVVDVSSVVNLGSSNVSFEALGENVSVAIMHLQKALIFAGIGGQQTAVNCSNGATVLFGGGGVLAAEVASASSGSSLRVQMIALVQVGGTVVVETHALVSFAGSVLTHSLQSISSVPQAGAICADFRVTQSVTVRDHGTLSVIGHRCCFSKQPNAAVARSAMAFEVTKAFAVQSNGQVLVSDNEVAMLGVGEPSDTHGCIGVAVRLVSSVTLTSGGALSVSGNSVSSLLSAVAGVSVELYSAFISGGALDVSFNDVSNMRCAMQNNRATGCAGLRVVFTQISLIFSNRAFATVSGNKVSSTVAQGVPYAAGILFYGGLRATNSSSVRIASNNASITVSSPFALQVCGIDVSMRDSSGGLSDGAALHSGSSLVLVLNYVTVVQQASGSVSGIRVALAMHSLMEPGGAIANDSTVGIVKNDIVVRSATSTVIIGIDCRGGGAVVNSSRLLLSSNAINVLGSTSNSPTCSQSRVAVSLDTSEPIAVNGASFLGVEENHVRVAGGSGIRVRCRAQASTRRTPGAFNVLNRSWCFVFGNVVSNSTGAAAASCGIVIDSANDEGLAVVVSGMSGLWVDRNVIVASVHCVHITWRSRFTMKLKSDATSAVSSSESLDACSAAIIEKGTLQLSQNSVASVGDAVKILFIVAYRQASVVHGGVVPKGFLLEDSAELLLRENHVVSISGHGLVLESSLIPMDPGTNSVASALVVKHATLSFFFNEARSLLAPIRWLTSVTGSSYDYSFDCSYNKCGFVAVEVDGVATGETVEVCTKVSLTCTTTRTDYAATMTIVRNSSLICLSGNVLIATSGVPAVVFDCDNGRSHTATFTSGASLLLHGNTLASPKTSVELFRCGPGLCIQSYEIFYYENDMDETYVLENDEPTILISSGSNISFIANGVWGSVSGISLTAQTLSVAGENSLIAFQDNSITSRFVCFSIVGDKPIISDLASWVFKANRCQSPLLASFTLTKAGTVSANAISFECDRVNSRLMQGAVMYRRAVRVDPKLAPNVDFRTCRNISFTSRQTRTHTWSGSLAVSSSLSAYRTKSLHTLQPSRTLLLSRTLSFGIVSATNGHVSRTASFSGVPSLMRFSSTPTHRSVSVSIEPAAFMVSTSSASTAPSLSVSSRIAKLYSGNHSSTTFFQHSSERSFTASVRCLSPTGLTAGLPQLFNDIFVSIDDASHRDLLHEDITVSHVLQPSSSAVLDILQAIDGQQVDQVRNITTTAEVDGMHSEAVVLQIRNRTTLFRLLLPRDLIGKAVSIAKSVHVTVDIASLVLPRVLCEQYIARVSLLRIQFVTQPKVSAMQLALRTSIEATVSGSLLASLFSGDVSNDLPALALTALMGCAPPSTAVSGGFGSLNVLAPLLLYESYASVIFSNVVLLACVALLLVLTVLVCYGSLRWRPQSALSMRLLQKLRLHQHRRSTGEYWAKISSFALTADEATKLSSRTLPSTVEQQAFVMDTLLHPVVVCLTSDEPNTCDVGLVPSATSTVVVLCTASLYDACLLVNVPSVLLSASLSLYPGTLFAAIRLMQLYQAAPLFNGAPSPFDVSAGGLAVGVVFTVILLPLPGLLYWVATRRIECSFHRYVVPLGESKQAYTVKFRMFTCCSWLEPYGRLLPSDASKLWGPLVGSSCRHWFWVVFSVFSGWVLCVGSLLQFYQERVYCTAVFAFSSVSTGVLAAALLVFRPKRSAVLNVLSAASLGITGVVLAFTALTGYDRRLEMSDTVAVCLGVLQAVASLAKSAAGFFNAVGMSLHGKRNAQMVLDWEIGHALSAEGSMAVRRYCQWRERRRGFATAPRTCESGMSAEEESLVFSKLLRASPHNVSSASVSGHVNNMLQEPTPNVRLHRRLDTNRAAAHCETVFDICDSLLDASLARSDAFERSCNDTSSTAAFDREDTSVRREAGALPLSTHEGGLPSPTAAASIAAEFWGGSEGLNGEQDEQDASVCEAALLRLCARQRRPSVVDGGRGLLVPLLCSQTNEIDELMRNWT